MIEVAFWMSVAWVVTVVTALVSSGDRMDDWPVWAQRSAIGAAASVVMLCLLWFSWFIGPLVR